MEDKIFIVENTGNFCYISTLIIGLFLPNSKINNLLTRDLKNTGGIYLQEFIKVNFIDQIKEGKSVLKETVEYIRNLCYQLGWRKNIEDNNEYQHQDLNGFYVFLMDIFENIPIEFKRTVKQNELNKNGTENIITLPFIKLSIPEDCNVIRIKDILHNCLYNNDYNITNSPILLPLSINRFNSKGEKIEVEIDIQKKIVPTIKKNYFYHSEWTFHCAICYNGDTVKNGHYYCLVSINDKMYLFNGNMVPPLTEVDLSDSNIVSMIKKECVFVIYRIM